MKHVVLAWIFFGLFTDVTLCAETDVAPLVKTICAVGPQGQGHRAAAAAWKSLSGADASQLTQILAGMKDANPLAINWLRAAVETIAQRHIHAGGRLPIPALESFLADTQQAPRARRLAYELIAKVDKTAEQRLIPKLADDSSVELRRDAVAMLLQRAAGVDAEKQKAGAIAAYQRALASARDLDQIQEAATKLKAFGKPADLPTHFGFVMSWKLIGPFDNTDKGGFNVVYGPEEKINLNATYEGKVGQVRWVDHTTQDEHGLVDLNKAIGKHMGAIAYAYAEFESDRDRDVELRLGCINGNKIWLNGKFLTANHVYHTGMQIDQYVAKARLQKGRNIILLKIAQNEQTEDWAQNWQYQLRVCDAVGTAVLALNRARLTSAGSGR